jgi:pimeloyl-ACP methyl ester carboxylesterase
MSLFPEEYIPTKEIESWRGVADTLKSEEDRKLFLKMLNDCQKYALAINAKETPFPADWFKANPDYLNYFPVPKESVSPEIMGKQTQAIEHWIGTGTCNAISNITQPTLIIVGTDDVFTPAPNSVTLVERIPGSWLVQIRNAGHRLIYQYPDRFNNIIMTFLQNNS